MAERDGASVKELRVQAAEAQAQAVKALEDARQELLSAEDDRKRADTFKAQAVKATMLAVAEDDKVLVVRLSEALVMWRHAHQQREQEAQHSKKRAEWMDTAYRHQNRATALLKGASLIQSPTEKPP